MKSIKHIRLTTFLLVLTFFSCQEQHVELDDKMLFKSWFIENIGQEGMHGRTVFWDKAKSLRGIDSLAGIVVPVWFAENERFGRQAIRELWVYKNKRGDFDSKLIEVTASTEAFYRDGKKINFSKLSGSISILDWHRGFLEGLVYLDGSPTQTIVSREMTPSLKLDKAKMLSSRSLDCGYQYSYVSNGQLYIVWASQPCFDLYSMLYRQSISYAAQWVDSQYGCEATSTCQDSYYYEPPYYEPDPIDYEKQARDELNYNKIDDSKLKPCMQTILNDVKNLSLGSAAHVIQRFSGAIPGYNWEVKDGTLPSLENAATSTNFNTSLGIVTTTFDASKFVTATDLSVARTILHESIHAYVVAVTYNTLTDPVQRQTLLGPDWGSVFLNYGHDYITNNYLGPIADALEEFGINRGYSFTRQFYEDLAWGGLTNYQMPPNAETALFRQIVPSSADRARIRSTISVEQVGIDMSGATKTQKGKNAGC